MGTFNGQGSVSLGGELHPGGHATPVQPAGGACSVLVNVNAVLKAASSPSRGSVMSQTSSATGTLKSVPDAAVTSKAPE